MNHYALALPILQSLYILCLFPMKSVTYLRIIIPEIPCLAGTRSILLGRMHHLHCCAYNIIAPRGPTARGRHVQWRDGVPTMAYYSHLQLYLQQQKER